MIEKFLVGTFFVLLAALLTSIITRNHKKREKIEAFREMLLPFKHILETGTFPDDRQNYGDFIKNLFADQDRAMIVIREMFSSKSRALFDQKWNEYKKEREEYNKPYWSAVIMQSVEHHMGFNNTLRLINEILDIAKNN